MKYLILFFSLTFLIQSCGGSNPEEVSEETSEMEVSTDANQQDLAQSYRQYMARRDNWFSGKSIKERGKINPFDEALRDTSFFVFREELIAALDQKAIFKLLEVVDEDVAISRDSLHGMAAFVRKWQLTTPDSIDQSPIWISLKRTLEKGGYFNRSRSIFTAPYYAGNSGLTATEGCILGQGVRIRKRPGLNAKVIKKSSFDIVEVLEVMEKKEMIGDEVFPWVHIKFPTGEEGYIWGKFLGQRNGQKVIFEKDAKGNWKLMEI